jgi:rhodanese-related sulfurtransferase
MQFKQVNPPEAYQLVQDGYKYVDVRAVYEFDEGHPKGAYNIPILVEDVVTGKLVSNPDFITVFQATFPTDAKLVVGCKAGPRSLQACQLLQSLGYSELVEMRGGFDGERNKQGLLIVQGWELHGLPIERDAAADHTYASLTRSKT